MKRVPNVTLHRASLANCSRIIKENLAGTGDDLPILLPYRNSVVTYFKELGLIMGLDLGSPQCYRNDINLALEQVREAMPEGPDLPPPPPISTATEVAGLEGTYGPVPNDGIIPTTVTITPITAIPLTPWSEGSFIPIDDVTNPTMHWGGAQWFFGAAPPVQD